jgi:hypothetical protein
MDTMFYDERYEELFEKYLNTYRNQLAEMLSDANDTEYVKEEFIRIRKEEISEICSFIHNNTIFVDIYKNSLKSFFLDNYKNYKTTPMKHFFANDYPYLKEKFIGEMEREEAGIQLYTFEHSFLEESNEDAVIDFLANYMAIEKSQSLKITLENNIDSDGFDDALNKLTHIQRALFFYYLQEGDCYPTFEQFAGKKRIEAIEETFKKYGIDAKYNEFNNQHYKITKKEYRLDTKNIKNIKTVIPLLIACAKAMELAKEELKLCKQKL